MLAIVASQAGALTAQAARSQGLPVVLIQGGIHAGEIDGKDAGFLALRELLSNREAPPALARQVLLFVPVFNVDGHERFGRWNRPNQRGPDEQGWRTTSQGYNLNREYVKADAPEMQAMLRLANDWDPLVVVDLHVTDGAKFEHDVAILVEPTRSGDAELQGAGRQLRDAVIADLAAKGSLPLPFYPSFVVNDDPASGIKHGVSPPRFSHGYFVLRNRLGMLVETHSWKDYRTRVRVTRNVIDSVLAHVAERGGEWMRVAKEADGRASALAGRPIALSYGVSSAEKMIDFRGYEFTRQPSEVSGALMTRYDETRPQIWRIPLRDDVVPDIVVTAPPAGYVVPREHAAWLGRKLDDHGIVYTPIATPLRSARVETFRAENAAFAANSSEGRHRVTLKGEWKPETRNIEAGALFAPIAQPKARLVAAILEPLAPDSLAAWGAFNIAFEKREYMEDYVAEEVAREMLARDPAVAAEFRRKLAEDPEFVKSKAQRLEFFYRRHASWDERHELYPVMRIGTTPSQK